MQWEAVETIADPGPDPLPPWVDFSNSGVPTVLTVPTATLVPVDPTAAVPARRQLRAGRAAARPGPVHPPVRHDRIASLHGPAAGGGDTRSATVVLNQPVAGSLQGALQLRIDAHDAALPAGQSPPSTATRRSCPSPSPGTTACSATTPPRSSTPTWGRAAAGPWSRSPASTSPATARACSATGRTRTPTGRRVPGPFRRARRPHRLRGRPGPEHPVPLRRRGGPHHHHGAAQQRHRHPHRQRLEGDRRRHLQFPGSAIVTHPGVVTRITDVVNINDTGQVINVGGIDMAAVYFDGDLVLDGAPANPDGSPRLVPAQGPVRVHPDHRAAGGGSSAPPSTPTCSARPARSAARWTPASTWAPAPRYCMCGKSASG